MRKIRKKKTHSGQFTLDGAFIFLFVSMLMVLSISVFGVILKANQLTAMATDLARYIEIRGTVDSSVYDELSRLEQSSGMDVDMAISSSGTIQFGEYFDLTLTYNAEFGVGGIVSTQIPLTTTVAGRGERYWR